MSRCAGHEPDRFPDVRARGAPTGPPTTGGSAVSRPGSPSTSGCRCCGCGSACWRWSRSAASARCCTPACGCSCRPSGTPLPLSPGLDAATRQGKRSGRRERRLADYGPLVAVGAIAIGVLLLVTLATGQSLSFGPLLLAGAGVAVLWWQADEAQRQRWLDPSRRMNPLRAIVGGGGWRAWLRIVAGLMLLIARDRAVLAALRKPQRRPQRRPRRRLRHPRPRLHGRARGCCACPRTSARSARPACGPRSARTWPPTCTTRCSRPWR